MTELEIIKIENKFRCDLTREIKAAVFPLIEQGRFGEIEKVAQNVAFHQASALALYLAEKIDARSFVDERTRSLIVQASIPCDLIKL